MGKHFSLSNLKKHRSEICAIIVGLFRTRPICLHVQGVVSRQTIQVTKGKRSFIDTPRGKHLPMWPDFPEYIRVVVFVVVFLSRKVCQTVTRQYKLLQDNYY